MRRARIEIYRAEDLGDRDAARGPKLWRRPANSALDDAGAPASRVVSRRHVLVTGARTIGEDGELAELDAAAA
eukprot:scaffold80700_cov21-Phaeocystis_antarctica.AAC.1